MRELTPNEAETLGRIYGEVSTSSILNFLSTQLYEAYDNTDSQSLLQLAAVVRAAENFAKSMEA